MMNNGGGYERIRASLLRQSEGSEGGGSVVAGGTHNADVQ